MTIEHVDFQQLQKAVNEREEALVCLGCGGDLQEWVDGVRGALQNDDVMHLGVDWPRVATLTTPGGRIDLVLFLPKPSDIDVGKLAMWRLRFGDCSWLSDYVVNYKSHHEVEEECSER